MFKTKEVLIVLVILSILVLSGCKEGYNPDIHKCVESECKPICNGVVCPEKPPTYCNMDLPNDESKCQIGYCDSCVGWEGLLK